MKKYKLCIYDFDGTIGDTKECVTASFQESLSYNKLPFVKSEDIVILMGLPLIEMFKKLTDKELPNEMYEKLVADYRNTYAELLKTKTKVFPDVIETLKILKEKNTLCSVATSKKTDIAKINCSYLHVDTYFELIVGNDMVKNKKPHPEMLEYTLQKLKIDKQDAVMIGDSTFDIEMGNAINMDTIAVTWGAHSKELLKTAHPSYIIDKFSQILDFV